MSHAGPTEIHDHVYGFKPSSHVTGCSDCRRTAEAVESEREALRDALREEFREAPPELFVRVAARRRPRNGPTPATTLSIAGLAAAAVLLGGLAWLLHQPPKKTDSTTLGEAGRRSQDDPLDRLIAELKSPSPERRNIAALALKAYGEAALEKLQNAKIDAALFPGYRLRPEDRELKKKLNDLKFDFDFDNETLDHIITAIGNSARIKIILDPGLRDKVDPSKQVTYRVKDLSGTKVLKLLLSQFGGDFRCEKGEVILVDPKSMPASARAPIRIGNRRGEAARHLQVLSSESPEAREKAIEALRRLGFAAEPALWEALDARDSEIHARAAEVLRWLYSPDESGESPGLAEDATVKKQLYERKLTIDMASAPLTAIADYLREDTGLTIHVAGLNNPDQLVTFKAADLPVHGILCLMLEPLRMEYRTKDNIVLLTKTVDPRGPRPRYSGNFWVHPDDAARAERLLAGLASENRSAQEKASAEALKLGGGMLGPLWKASWLLEGEAAERCGALRNRILDQLDLRIVEEPPVEDLQVRTPGQQGVLDHTIDVEAVDASLEDLLKKYGAPYALKASLDRKFSFSVKGLRFESLLKALTRPYGLDFYIEGGTVVIDTAANVRAAVEALIK